MSMDEELSLRQLRRRLEALAETLPAAELQSAEDYLAHVVFADPKFAPHLGELIARLLSATPVHSFTVEADPDERGYPMRYTALWYNREQPPILISYTRYWRGEQSDRLGEDDGEGEDTDGDTSESNALPARIANDTPAAFARPDLLETNAQGHSEQPAAPARTDDLEEEETEAIAAEIARVEAEIARLEQLQRLQRAQRPRWQPSIVEQPDPPTGSGAASPAPAPGWQGKTF